VHRAVGLVTVIAFLAGVLSVAAKVAPPSPAGAVETGMGPCGAVVAHGAVWVAVYGAGTLVRIDPRRAHVTRRFRVGRNACSVAATADALWVTRDRSDELVRVDRRTGKTRRTRVGREPFDVAVTNSIWTTSFADGTVSRIDATTLKTVALLRVGGSPAGLTLCGGRLWVGGGRHDDWLTSVDPVTNRLVRVDVGVETPAWPRCIAGDIWSPTAHGIIRIDPQSHGVLATVALEGTIARVAAGIDSLVWVTDKEGNRIIRVDPATNEIVDELPAGPGAFDLVAAAGSMWVTSFAGSDVRRYVLR
jgi:streptogramin lyase